MIKYIVSILCLILVNPCFVSAAGFSEQPAAALMLVLDDPSVSSRLAAVRAFSSKTKEEIGPQAAQKLVWMALGDRDSRVRVEAVYSLGELGIEDSKLQLELTKNLDDPNDLLKFETIRALGKMKALKSLKQIMNFLDSPFIHFRLEAVKAVQMIGVQHPISQSVQIRLAKKTLLDSDPSIQLAGLHALSVFHRNGEADYSVLNEIVKALGSPFIYVRTAAAKVLGEMQPEYSFVHKALVEKGLSDVSNVVRLACVHALGNIDIKETAVMESFLGFLSDSNAHVKRQALQILEKQSWFKQPSCQAAFTAVKK